MIRLDISFPLRSYESSSSSLSLHLDHFHTSILSFLFSIVINNSPQNQILQKNIFPSNYFEQLPELIQNSIEQSNSDECIQRYLQIFAICKTPSLPLIQLSISDLGKHFPLFTRHKLFDVLKNKEEQEMKEI